MKGKFLHNLCIVLLGVFTLSVAAWADTLEMKDGRLVQGKYLGGSENHIRFLVNGKEEFFNTKDVMNLSFNDATEGSSPQSASNSPSRGGRGTVTVPAGTRLLVRMIDGVDSSTNKVGDRFRASLEDALVVGDTVVAPKGTDVIGRLTETKSAGHIQGRSELRLELTGISINGQMQALATSDYDVAGKSRGAQSAKRIGGGAAVGAIIGAIAGGGKGAAIGAGVGGAAGTAVQVFTHGEKVKVPSETMLEFTLEHPFTTTVSQPSGR